MGYIDRNLLTDERIVYRTKKHVIIFLGAVFWTAAAFFCLFYPDSTVNKIAFAPAIVALLTWANQWLSFITSDFVVTNKRVLMKEGFFTRHATELRLSTVSSVTVNQTLLGQILNYGTVVINPFGGTSDVFSMIASPVEFQKQAESQAEAKG